MGEDLRRRLHQEMSGQHRPPVDGLVTSAVSRGRQKRRARRVGAGVGTAAVVGITVLAVGVGAAVLPNHAASSTSLGAGAGSGGGTVTPLAVSTTSAATSPAATSPAATSPAATSPAATSSAATTAAAPAVDPSAGAAANASADPKLQAALEWKALQAQQQALHPPHWTGAPVGVPATPQGELQLFTDLAKQYGTVSNYAASDDADKTHVRAYLTAPDGNTGMVQLSMYHDTLGHAADCLHAPAAWAQKYGDMRASVTCHPLPDGGYAMVMDKPQSCVMNASVTVVHPDGTEVEADLSTCLTSLTNQLSDGAQTLSTAQAESIITNPGFDFTMPAELVARGAQNIGTLPTFW